ncbi:MAG: type III-B CRISPR module RAMP protein Cmr1 [Crenarchaeota archaeon]|nr:type III-B CRISPR module RAMP protein Cmr1 [Thermoproteota archaeon]
MSAIIELELTSDTASFLGGYDTQPHSWDVFRTQSLKGLWRWWLRAYVMGILYDRGILTFRSSNVRLAELSRDSITIVQKLTTRLLGGVENASKFRILATVLRHGRENQCPRYGDQVCNCQRVRLLTIGGKRVKYIPYSVVRLTICERPSRRDYLSREEIFLGIGTLLTGFVFDGLGKMSRRGLGTYTIRLVNDNTRMFLRFFSRDRILSYEKVPELVYETLNCCEKYINSTLHECSKELIEDLPPCDLVSRRYVKVPERVNGKFPENVKEGSIPVFSIYEVRWSGKNAVSACVELQDFFFRPGRIKRYYGSPNTPYGHWKDLISVNKYAWILGLPREQRGTGYIVHNIDRRASPIHVSVHKDRAYITCFISLDWPRHIDWAGASSMPIEVDRDRILETFIRVLSYFEDYLKKLRYSYRVVFP